MATHVKHRRRDPPAPWGGFEPPTWRLHETPRFPVGTDYLFAIALEALGAGRIVSEPSRSVLRAWLRIAMVTTHRRFPAIHPVTPLSFPKGLPLTVKPLALPLSYQGKCIDSSVGTPMASTASRVAV